MFSKLKIFKKWFLLLSVLLILIVGIQSPWQYLIEGVPIKLYVSLKIDKDDAIQLFYTIDENEQFNEPHSIKTSIKGSNSLQTVNFVLPNKDIKKVRVDIGTNLGKVEIDSFKLKHFNKEYLWDADSIETEFSMSPDIKAVKVVDRVMNFTIGGGDPYLSSGDITEIYNEVKDDPSINIFAYTGIAIILVCLIFIILSLYSGLLAFLKGVIQSRTLIFELAKKDLQSRYLGSNLGIVWAFIQPIVTIVLLWFVFQIGFKSTPVENVPFVLWLICGMIPWFFFSESIQGATNSVIDNNYLVKKIVFRVSILPIIRIMSALFVHVFFIAVIFLMFSLYGYKPSIYNIQVLYYLFATIILVLGLSWLTSSLIIFFRDLGQVVGIIIQFGFWITPIFWSFKTMPEQYRFILTLNPAYYIVEGYRDAFINHIWFWQHYNLTINFWIITFGLFFAGAILFKRLRPHFTDVL